MHKKRSLISRNEFIFFDVKGDIDAIGWNPKNYSKLWVYNLHYFDFLNTKKDSNNDKFTLWQKIIINRWIGENPYPDGIPWDSYPTSLRIVNWTKWIMNGNSSSIEMIESLNFQTEWLYKRIEWHLLGNHLFSNAKALLFSSILLDGKNCSKWFKKSLKIINKELQEQVLDDGGNFELSPMYHAIFLEDLLDIIQLSIAFPDSFKKDQIQNWIKVALKMLRWLEVMTHSDGKIALFNDSALNIASTFSELNKYAEKMGLLDIEVLKKEGTEYKLKHLKDSGYARLSNSNLDLLVDIGNVGPSYLPAHAHADTLSFELSYKLQRVFVNGGTSTYETSQKRNEERSTSSHNTVVLNNKNSSDVWSSFRVGRRAKPFDLKIKQIENSFKVSCSHDGYSFMAGNPIHNREWHLQKNKLVIIDKIFGKYNSAIAHYIIHPDVKIIEKSKGNFSLILVDGNEMNMITNSIKYELIDFKYAPHFGNTLSTKAIKLYSKSGIISCCLEWSE